MNSTIIQIQRLEGKSGDGHPISFEGIKGLQSITATRPIYAEDSTVMVGEQVEGVVSVMYQTPTLPDGIAEAMDRHVRLALAECGVGSVVAADALTKAQREAAANTMSDYLQSAFDADPRAMYALAINRVPCNQTLADHPHMVVDAVPVIPEPAAQERWMVGLLGVVAGICTALRIPIVSGKFDTKLKDEQGREKMVGFCVTNLHHPDETPPLGAVSVPAPADRQRWVK